MHRHPYRIAVLARLNRADERGVTTTVLTAELVFDPADPYAVGIELNTRRGGVCWMIGRDLLIAGVEGGSIGDGDVRISTATVGETDITVVTFGPPEVTPADISFNTADLITLLAVAEEMVPGGTESRAAAGELDRWIRTRPGPAGPI